MASLKIYRKSFDTSGYNENKLVLRTLSGSKIGPWDEIPVNEQRIEVESVNENTDTTSIKVELLVVVDGEYEENVFDSLNNSFYFECNDEWITVLRNRNLITLVIKNNYSNEGRMGMVSFYHNVSNITYVNDIATDNTIKLLVMQEGHEYSVKIEGVDGEVMLESLPNGFEVKDFFVKSVGGREDFKVKSVKKYNRLTIQENEESEPYELIKLVPYDNAFQIEYIFDDETKKRCGFRVINYGNINCNYADKCITKSNRIYPMIIKDCYQRNATTRQLIVDYYYEISVYNVDCIDETDTISLRYSSGDEEKISITPTKKPLRNATPKYLETFIPQIDHTNGLIDEIIECYNNDEFDRYNELVLKLEDMIKSENNNTSGEVEAQGLITCSPSELIFEHSGGTLSAFVTTVPEDSAVYTSNYSDFIKSCSVIGHEIRVTINRNPYPSNRNCIIYLTNAMCPSAKNKILITQKGKP